MQRARPRVSTQLFERLAPQEAQDYVELLSCRPSRLRAENPPRSTLLHRHESHLEGRAIRCFNNPGGAKGRVNIQPGSQLNQVGVGLAPLHLANERPSGGRRRRPGAWLLPNSWRAATDLCPEAGGGLGMGGRMAPPSTVIVRISPICWGYTRGVRRASLVSAGLMSIGSETKPIWWSHTSSRLDVGPSKGAHE
jgi:hypothetical protein